MGARQIPNKHASPPAYLAHVLSCQIRPFYNTVLCPLEVRINFVLSISSGILKITFIRVILLCPCLPWGDGRYLSARCLSLPICLSVHLSIRPSVCLSVCLSVCTDPMSRTERRSKLKICQRKAHVTCVRDDPWPYLEVKGSKVTVSMAD